MDFLFFVSIERILSGFWWNVLSAPPTPKILWYDRMLSIERILLR